MSDQKQESASELRPEPMVTMPRATYYDLKAQAQRLADALKKAQTFIAKLEKMDVLPVNSDSALDWDTRFIIREALAQWEGSDQ